MMEVAFADLGRAVAADRDELDAAVARVLASGRFVLGDEVAGFERELPAALGAAGPAIGVASGTDAIELALRGLGVGPGDEVVTQANTCVPTVAAIARSGATPVLCDADPETAMIDPGSLEAAVGPRTKAVVPVHLYGQVRPGRGSRPDRRGGRRRDGRGLRPGARRDAATGARPAASATPPRSASTRPRTWRRSGTAAPSLARTRRSPSACGCCASTAAARTAGTRSPASTAASTSSRPRSCGPACPSSPSAASGDARSPPTTSTRSRTPPRRPCPSFPDREQAWHLFVVRAPDRERFRGRLRERGVGTLVHYDHAIHQLDAFAALGAGPVPLEGAETLAREVVSLPLYPELSDAEVEYVASSAADAAR